MEGFFLFVIVFPPSTITNDCRLEKYSAVWDLKRARRVVILFFFPLHFWRTASKRKASKRRRGGAHRCCLQTLSFSFLFDSIRKWSGGVRGAHRGGGKSLAKLHRMRMRMQMTKKKINEHVCCESKHPVTKVSVSKSRKPAKERTSAGREGGGGGGKHATSELESLFTVSLVKGTGISFFFCLPPPPVCTLLTVR